MSHEKQKFHDEEQALEALAIKHLGIPTLSLRNMDDLDFHDLSVTAIHRALRAAFEAGVESCGPVMTFGKKAVRS